MKYPGLLEKKIVDLFDFQNRRLYDPNDSDGVWRNKTFTKLPLYTKPYDAMLKKMVVLPKSRAYVGIEVELEYAPDGMFPGWKVDKDGSLRNNGKEYISHVYPYNVINHQIAGLFTLLAAAKPKPEFTWRTSIHIHLCVRDRTIEEVLKLFLLYLTFERVLFFFADQQREKSVFCVPVIRSSLAQTLADFCSQRISIDRLMQNWHKYSALNLIRLGDYGTVEFRHLSGTWDVHKISAWIGILLSLYESSINLSLDAIIEEIKILNTTSNYSLFRDTVFGNFGKYLAIPEIELVSEGISFCKECLSGINQIKIEENSSMMKYVRRTQLAKKDNPLRRPSIAELRAYKEDGGDIKMFLQNKPQPAVPQGVNIDEFDEPLIHKKGIKEKFISKTVSLEKIRRMVNVNQLAYIQPPVGQGIAVDPATVYQQPVLKPPLGPAVVWQEEQIENHPEDYIDEEEQP